MEETPSPVTKEEKKSNALSLDLEKHLEESLGKSLRNTYDCSFYKDTF